MYLDDEPDISRYTLAFDYLRAKAIDPEDVGKMLTGVARDL